MSNVLSKEQRQIRRRIDDLKSNLRATDYQAIKFAEGELTAEEYAETKQKRIAWRKEINELEAQLQATE